MEHQPTASLDGPSEAADLVASSPPDADTKAHPQPPAPLLTAADHRVDIAALTADLDLVDQALRHLDDGALDDAETTVTRLTAGDPVLAIDLRDDVDDAAPSHSS